MATYRVAFCYAKATLQRYGYGYAFGAQFELSDDARDAAALPDHFAPQRLLQKSQKLKLQSGHLHSRHDTFASRVNSSMLIPKCANTSKISVIMPALRSG
jgi:hypothetical protein